MYLPAEENLTNPVYTAEHYLNLETWDNYASCYVPAALGGGWQSQPYASTSMPYGWSRGFDAYYDFIEWPSFITPWTGTTIQGDYGGYTYTLNIEKVPVSEGTWVNIVGGGEWTYSGGQLYNGNRVPGGINTRSASPSLYKLTVATKTPSLLGAPTIAVGDMVGVVVSIDHQDRNSDEDSDCYTRAAFFLSLIHI